LADHIQRGRYIYGIQTLQKLAKQTQIGKTLMLSAA
jgi:hypothetical protein